MKTILAIFLIVLLLLPISAVGEIQIITHTVKQPFGGSQSPDDARIAAVAKAKREALELAGTYVESTTVVKNAQVEKDEILTLTAGVLKAEVVSEKNYTTGDAFGIEVTVRVEVDTAVLEARLKKDLEDRTHFELLKFELRKQASASEKELLKKNADLERENRKSGKSKQKSASLKKEFQAVSRGLTAIDWFEKGSSMDITNIEGAVEAFSKAIELNPKMTQAFVFRGMTYGHLLKHRETLDDFNKAIELIEMLSSKEGISIAYSLRAMTHARMKNYEKAIDDSNRAIRLCPSSDSSGLSFAYLARGFSYAMSGKNQEALLDFDKTLSAPKSAMTAVVYQYRGTVYFNMGNFKQAINDYEIHIKLFPFKAEAFVHYNLGIAYAELGNAEKALDNTKISARLGDQRAQRSPERSKYWMVKLTYDNLYESI
ncbi:MAG: tetratricopeptide repeat protein [Proteobacteria bacterium]|nr:tetratricopeptide repeat protein [Pseudomonadota bacterium]